jgi:DNA polymerase
VVFGAGRVGAPLFIVGDQPGPDDDLTGEAWSGRVGRLLTRMLRAIGRVREDAFLAHLVKCRSAGGRDPTRAELDTCRPFLLRQLQAVGPRVVVAAGPIAARLLTGSDAPATSLRGRLLNFEGVPLVVTLDPAYLLATPRMKAHAWDDLRLIREVLQTS